MKKLLLVTPLLIWSATAGAQQVNGNADQCTPATTPVIERIDVSATDAGESSAVLRVDVVATAPDGSALNYEFHGYDGSISSQGAAATWNVNGNGRVEGYVEVGASGYGCVSYGNFTYDLEHQSASDE